MPERMWIMQGRVTIKDIAERTGTSVASVHRALYGTGGVSDALRQKILEEAERSHYRIDETASLLRRNTLNITVLLPKAAGNERFYYKGLWQGVHAGAEQMKKLRTKVRFVETEYGVDDISEALERLYDEIEISGEKLDGMVTICDDEKSRVWIERFIRKGTKVALIDRGFPIEGLSCMLEVSVTDMGKLALELALLYGQSRQGPILLVNGHSTRVSYKAYSKAIRSKEEAMARQNTEIMEIWTDSEEQVKQELRQALESRKFSAVIAASARTTYWVCQEVEKMFDLEEDRPPVIGTDVFEEQVPYFENGILKAAVYQAHMESGEKCLEHLVRRMTSFADRSVECITVPLSVVMKDNYRYFLPHEEQ